MNPWIIESVITVTKDNLPKAIAWMVYTQDGQSVYVTDNPIDIQEGQRALPLYTAPPPCPTCDALARTVMLDQTSHDTQRKPLRDWVGLTDEEIDSITGKIIGWNSACGWEADYARAIEAKLKERNT